MTERPMSTRHLVDAQLAAMLDMPSSLPRTYERLPQVRGRDRQQS